MKNIKTGDEIEKAIDSASVHGQESLWVRPNHLLKLMMRF